jgi:hypothetical protein
LVGEIISSGNPKLHYKIRTKCKYSFASIYNQIFGVLKILANQEIDVKILLADWLFRLLILITGFGVDRPNFYGK